MNLSVGIVGLPNVGKSTLFNSLLKRQQALVANYPFATIEPNVGVVGVPDSRLEKLADIVAKDSIASPGTGQYLASLQNDNRLPPIKPATVNFVDIAGLVKGASEGAGLGNKFLSHIREVSVIAHVVRAFEDADVVREGSVGPKEDYETINTELILADIQSIQKILENRKIDSFKKSASEKLIKELNTGRRAYDVLLSEEEKMAMKDIFLLSSKPEIIVLNVSENDYTDDKFDQIVGKYSSAFTLPREQFVVISAKIESELASLSEEEQKEYLKDLGLEFSGLERLIQKAYEELGLISFLTAGEKEVRAWTIKKGSTAVEASGEIHTDFMKKFIKAEVVGFDNFVEFGGWKGCRENGKAMFEGRDYTIRDGDVVEFKIGT